MTTLDIDSANRILDHNFQVARHSDGNVNRLLGATAFLALGGFTLFFPSGRFGELRFAGTQMPAGDVFFFLFDAGIFLAVAFALASLHAGSAEDTRSPSQTLVLADPRSITPATLASQLTEIAAHYRAAALEKSRYVARSRGATEFAMINLALLGTARLPDVSAATKSWLAVSVLAVYGYGACWRMPWMRLRIETLLEASFSGLVLLTAGHFRSYWWAIGTSLSWIAISRTFDPHTWIGRCLRLAWVAAALGAFVFIVVR